MPIPPDFLARALDLAQMVTVGGVVGGVRLLWRIHKRSERLETILTGVDGDNGMRKSLANIEQRVDGLDDRVLVLEVRAKGTR